MLGKNAGFIREESSEQRRNRRLIKAEILCGIPVVALLVFLCISSGSSPQEVLQTFIDSDDIELLDKKRIEEIISDTSSVDLDKEVISAQTSP